jgi:hypothetical protein
LTFFGTGAFSFKVKFEACYLQLNDKIGRTVGGEEEIMDPLLIGFAAF